MNVTPEIKTMHVRDLKKAPYNPRKIDEDKRKALAASLKRFGLVEPLIYNKRSGFLISGHQRLSVLEEEGVREVPVVIVDLPEIEEKALNVTLNSPEVAGEFDFIKLEETLRQVESELPDASDQLRMFALLGDSGMDPAQIAAIGGEKKVFENASFGAHPEMELQAYENYDYIVLFFKDSRDYMRAVQYFGLEMVNHSFTAKRKIGLGRCIDGAKYLEKVIGCSTSTSPTDAKNAELQSPVSIGQTDG